MIGMRNAADRRPQTQTRGFTLIELLCVIVIICVFFSLSIPMLSKTAGNFYLRNKAAQLKAMCELLKRTSISERKTYKLVIDFSQNSYSVLRSSNETPDEFFVVKDSLLKPRTLPESMSFFSPDSAADKQEIIFKQTGAISAAVFFISNNKDNTAKLSTTLSGEILLEYI